VPGRFKSSPAHMPPFVPQARELVGFRRQAPLEKMPPYALRRAAGRHWPRQRKWWHMRIP
jgi:hypothetical protein